MTKRHSPEYERTIFSLTRGLMNARFSHELERGSHLFDLDDSSLDVKTFSFRDHPDFIDLISDYSNKLGMSKADFVRTAISHAMALIDEIEADFSSRLNGEDS